MAEKAKKYFADTLRSQKTLLTTAVGAVEAVGIPGSRLLAKTVRKGIDLAEKYDELFRCYLEVDSHHSPEAFRALLEFAEAISADAWSHLALLKSSSPETDNDDPCAPPKGNLNYQLTCGFGKNAVQLPLAGTDAAPTNVIWERERLPQSRGVPIERIRLRVAKDDIDNLRRFVLDLVREYAERVSNRLLIYEREGDSWSPCSERPRRSRDSLVLRDSLLDDIVDDVQQFLSSRPQYQALGKRYKRGYLLYGPPGCGKSSMVEVIASEFRMPVYVVRCSDRRLDDDSLQRLLLRIPPHSLLLMEDVDVAWHGEASSARTGGGLTFSGMLNSLDGVGSFEGSLLVMTTNFRDRLPSRLIRPGRIDRQFHLELPGAPEACRMLQRAFPNVPDSFARGFATLFERRSQDARINMAALQEVFLEAGLGQAWNADIAQVIRARLQSIGDPIPDVSPVVHTPVEPRPAVAIPATESSGDAGALAPASSSLSASSTRVPRENQWWAVVRSRL